MCPLYAGEVLVNLRSASICRLVITTLDPAITASTNVLELNCTAGASAPTMAVLPQSQCIITLSNNGSTTNAVLADITGMDIIWPLPRPPAAAEYLHDILDKLKDIEKLLQQILNKMPGRP